MFGAKKSRIEKLIRSRDANYRTHNEKVMQELSKVISPAVAFFVTKMRGTEAGARVQVTSADLVEHPQYPEGVLLMWGNTPFEAGEEIHDDNGNLYTLTHEDAMTLSTPIQVAIPLYIAETGTLQQIVVYLEEQFAEAIETMRKIREKYHQQLEEQEQNTGDLMVDNMYNAQQPEDLPELDLDLSEYSEEEQLMIRESYKKNGKTIQ